MREFAARIVSAKLFERLIIGLILLNGVVIGAETSSTAVAWASDWMNFFVSFVIVGTFVVVNLFIAVVVNNLDEAKQERLDQLAEPTSRDQLRQELRDVRESLARLERRLRHDA